MTSRLLGRVPVAVCLAVMAGAATASAQTGTGGNGGTMAVTLAKADFEIYVQQFDDDGAAVNLTTAELLTYFNRARCECEIPVRIIARPAVGVDTAKFGYFTNGTVRMMIGPDCAQNATGERDLRCSSLGEPQLLADFAKQSMRVDTTVKAVFTTGGKTADCPAKAVAQNIWLLVDLTADGTIDLTGESAASLPLQLDGAPPPAPTVTAVRGGNEAIEIDWTGLDSTVGVFGYQVFCSRAEDIPVFESGTFSIGYQSQSRLCPDGPGTTRTSSLRSANAGTGQEFPAPSHFRDVDPAFVCSSELSSTQSSARISILQNDIPYLVGVAAIDKAYNASPIEFVYLQKPVPSNDFLQGYKNQGGSAEGGYCAAGGSAMNGAGWAAAALAMAVALGRRKRR